MCDGCDSCGFGYGFITAECSDILEVVLDAEACYPWYRRRQISWSAVEKMLWPYVSGPLVPVIEMGGGLVGFELPDGRLWRGRYVVVDGYEWPVPRQGETLRADDRIRLMVEQGDQWST